MGCSPSKGQISAGLSSHNKQAMQFESHKNNSDLLFGGTEIQSKTEEERVSDGLMLFEEESTVPFYSKRFSLSDTQCDTDTIIKESVDVEGTNSDLQEGLMTPKNNEIGKKSKGDTRYREKECLRKTAHIMSKEDHSKTMVRAQHAAFAYLNPNILKYESLLGLLDQATQTQLSLQPIVTLLALHYEEIICALEEMAVEGEKMLEEYGNHVTWPPAQRDDSLIPGKHYADLYSDEPLYLLQQMLQHSMEKNRLIGDSVKVLGDTALEEAADCFTSLSRLLKDKLKAKKMAEGRMRQVLAQVEATALGRSIREDGTLHSEDSGLGADNECRMSGSVRLHYHRESLGSGASIVSSSGVPENKSPDQPQLNRVEEGRVDDSKDDEDYCNDHEKSYNVSQFPNLGQDLLQVGLQNRGSAIVILERANQREKKIRRPKTADTFSEVNQEKHNRSHLMGLWRSRSVDCLYSKVKDCKMHVQQKSQNDDKKLKWLTNGGTAGVVFGKESLRRHSSEAKCAAPSCDQQRRCKGTFKSIMPSNSLPTFTPAPPGRNAVKHLINTFTQREQDKSNQDPFKKLMKIKATKNVSLLMLANNNGYSINQRFSNRIDGVDVDSFPPPPPEVLMDSSFDSKEDPSCNEEDGRTLHHQCTTQKQRRRLSQRLRASLQTVNVLPSQPTFSQGSVSISASYPVRHHDVVGGRPGQEYNQQTGVSTDKEEAASIYQHSRKIIHLQHSSDSPDKKGHCDQSIFKPLAVKQGTTGRYREFGEGEAARLYLNSCAPTTPPVSRARLPPSHPSAHHRVPSPPAPLTPPCHVSEKRGASTTPLASHMEICTMGNFHEKNTITPFSASFNDARSVFCQKTHSGHQSLTTCCRSTLPRPWGEPCKGRHQVTHLAQAFMRNNPSSHMTSLTDQQQLLPNTKHLYTQDREPITLQSERGKSASISEIPRQSEQEIQPTCSATYAQSPQHVLGKQENEPKKIMD